MITHRFAFLALLILAGCTEPLAPAQTIWQAELLGQDLSGSAAAVSTSDRTRFSIQIEGAEAGKAYAWRVSENDCNTEGALVGGAAVFSAMTASVSGSATAEAIVGRPLASGRQYAVRVALTDQPGQVLMCGELVRS